MSCPWNRLFTLNDYPFCKGDSTVINMTLSAVERTGWIEFLSTDLSMSSALNVTDMFTHDRSILVNHTHVIYGSVNKASAYLPGKLLNPVSKL